jgi:Ca-activated chloride channel homolog
MVAVYATARDAAGRLAPDLDRTAFDIRDNGRRVDLAVFSKDPEPLTVAVALDMSGSMAGHLLQVKNAARGFIDALRPGDSARLVTFGDEIAVSPLLTGDKGILRRVLDEELWPFGSTPLWPALQAAISSIPGTARRKVVLVLSDGLDNATLPGWPGTPADVSERAAARSVMVYAIGMQDAPLPLDLTALADASGGGHFDLRRDADLAETFAAVAEELRHQYLLGFEPQSLDGKVHRLAVRPTRPGLTIRAAKRYVAALER